MRIMPNNPTDNERHEMLRSSLREVNREEDFEYIVKVMTPPPDITTILPVNSLKGKKIGIIGAGCAGLSAAYELRKLGCDITILEANLKRIGGRVYTHFFGEGLYGEFGAMRIPVANETTWHYINELKLNTNPFFQNSENNILYVKRQAFTGLDINEEVKKRLYPLFNLTDSESDIPFSKLIEYVYNHPIRSLRVDLRPYIIAIRNKYPEAIRYFDNLDFRGYLRDIGFSTGAIDLINSSIGADSGFFYFNFLEILKEHYPLSFTNLYEITGGLYKLPYAFYDTFSKETNTGKVTLKMGTRVTGIYDRQKEVAIRYINAETNIINEEVFDYCVTTIPFSTLRLVDIYPLFSNLKMEAIREANYSPSQKTLILFNERFWERTINGRIVLGGRLITDLPIISAWFPSHRYNERYGVMVSSYNMNLDTTRVGNLDENYRLYEILRQLEEAFGFNRGYLDNKVVDFKTINWNRYIYSLGAFQKYYIRQNELFAYPSLTPEFNNKVFFAGEHTGGTHGWIQGALLSGKFSANLLAQCTKKTLGLL